MPVAPSYQTYKQIGEPYEKGGKVYVRLEHPNTHNIREARFYTDQEYMRLYNKPTPDGGTKLRPLKDVLGFSKGYVTIFKGNVEALEEWFKLSSAWFHRLWGWNFRSEEPLPQDLPAGITPIQLAWTDVGYGENTLKAESFIKAHIDSLLYDTTPSQHVGSIGERLTLTLTLLNDIIIDGGQYGPKHFYIFEDADKNKFTWTTQAKVLTIGTTYSLKGTVKDHVRYKGEAQTALLRCSLLS